MQQLGFRSVFAKLFASVMLALTLFAVAMVLLTQLVHDKDAGIRSEILATQILGQIDPFLHELNISISKDNHLQSRFMLAVVKKSFDIFDESLQAKMGLYDSEGRLLMQTDNSDLPLELPPTPSLFSRVFPSLADTSPTKQAQVYSSTGYTLLYESRLTPKKPVLSAALNLFTGTLLLLLIMAGVLWLIARTMTWRIDQLSQQMTQLGDGDFTVRVNARGNDEIAALARGFNQAAQKIEHLIDANKLLLAHASHELRTPITRIRLQIEMMDMLAGALPTDTKAKFDKRAQAINRDLSGLNDLVESILLVSRLDAGHALQQVENLDLYDLVNQERQHYPEATLIGEHIVIDGQSSMLTHLIRNLLTNAMLHGKPPVTVLLYGVQSIEEAGTVPDYLLQTVLCSSFVDYNSLDFDDYEENADAKVIEHQTAKHEATSSVDKNKSDTTDSIAELPTPIIYRNGEDIVARNENNESNDEVSIDDDFSDDSLIDNASKPQPTTSESSLLADYYSFTSELTDRIKKVIWKAVPDSTEPASDADNTNNANVTEVASTSSISNVESENTGILIENSVQKSDSSITDAATKNNGSNNTKDDAKSNSSNNENSGAVVRKEGLFAKHMKKAKTEPERPLPKYAVLAVIDEGTGIPEGKREEVFSPFVRLQQKNKGSGLGLSLVSQIVTAHQGRIITDTLNGHTRFLVTIPIHHDPHYNYHE
ncbi:MULTISPECIES: sensor histidine kinase [Psychrobacter]|uniref:sensor histidine kinase n=1 Tax=Psychrobacter TaxID=497 RepID=UPI000C33CB2F|nr:MULTISPECIES: sensor histidine kinase [Psychrobacter]MBA6244648.1 sensor histidine kinase [Psychrobacter sp. Urea-trap-18]MBA6285148.1 sensor histidine kinase [Psychrobacter sp. Urea-trap-16]MBA6319551.1 sensor histidine kinase [Psychrobacter sp. Urea-trap-20]MBA6334124.1 sensor histidine kinase [Psychrobacter sp. Urea-trap-19]PKG59762.1 HAMP domain-containing histidine kinase [Psychrobacter sp. Choline-3u-12]